VTDPARPRGRAPIKAGGGGTTATARRRRPIAFGVHQLLEYFFAVALVVLSVHVGRSDLLLAGGAALGLLALTARGPLGLVRVCGRRLHALFDVTAGLLLALAPLVGPLRPGVVGIVAIEVVAVVWLRVAMLTRYTVRADTAEVTAAGATTPPSSSADADRAAGDRAAGAASSAIRHWGRLMSGARNRLPGAQAALESGARQMGSQAGRLQRAWRRATR